MEIILLDKVPYLGELGDIVQVKPGYARNFLFPRGLAAKATKQSIAQFEALRSELEAKRQRILAEAQAQAERIEGLTIQIVRSSGIDGRLYGSVSAADIATELKQHAVDLHKSNITLPGSVLKVVGEVTACLKLHQEVEVDIIVSVLGEENTKISI